jgi:EAL domain-containing protein (putative c-di-GMP-specific phosphodiesterase class I)
MVVRTAMSVNDVVAEGVEDERTAEAIVELGCEGAQGYLFCRPLPAADLCAWIAARPSSLAPAPVPV